MEKLPLEGKPLISSVSAIQAFYDVFGDMKAVGSTLDILDDGFQFTGKFVTTDGEKYVLYIPPKAYMSTLLFSVVFVH